MQTEMIYYGGIILASVLAIMAQKFTKTKKKFNFIFWLLSFVILLLIMGFRTCGVGVDDNSYQSIFHAIADEGIIGYFKDSTMEIGYITLNYIISIFTDNFQVVIFITSLIGLGFYYSAIRYEVKNINLFLAVFLFATMLFFYFFGIIRLFIACSIIAYSLRYVFEKKTMKFVLFVLLATSFHYSALFMLILLYFSTEKEGHKRNDKVFLTLGLLIMPILIFVVSTYIFPNMGERYNQYTSAGSFTLSLDCLDKLPILIVALIFYKRMIAKNEHMRVYVMLYAFSTIVALYSSMLSIGRMAWYSNFAICFILPAIYDAIKETKVRQVNLIYVPLVLLYGVIYSYRIVFLSVTNLGMTNYTNILF